MSSTERLALVVILVLGLLVRILPVLSAAAAVGDGGPVPLDDRRPSFGASGDPTDHQLQRAGDPLRVSTARAPRRGRIRRGHRRIDARPVALDAARDLRAGCGRIRVALAGG